MRYPLRTFMTFCGVRLTYFDGSDTPLAEVSARSEMRDFLSTGSILDDARHVVMVRFSEDEIDFRDFVAADSSLDCPPNVEDRIRHAGASRIQSAYRRFVVLGEPSLRMPPLWTI